MTAVLTENPAASSGMLPLKTVVPCQNKIILKNFRRGSMLK